MSDKSQGVLDRPAHDVAGMERRASELGAQLERVFTEEERGHFLQLIVKPWFTTPAEWKFVTGIFEAMEAQVAVLTQLKGVLLKGSAAVEQR